MSHKPLPIASDGRRFALGDDGGGKACLTIGCIHSTTRATSWVPAEIITCDNDEQVIERARKLKRRHGIEVWQAARLVAKIA
jgi:hypothetical protein